MVDTEIAGLIRYGMMYLGKLSCGFHQFAWTYESTSIYFYVRSSNIADLTHWNALSKFLTRALAGQFPDNKDPDIISVTHRVVTFESDRCRTDVDPKFNALWDWVIT